MSRTKKKILISINKEVYDDIALRKEDEGFIFSHWVEDCYRSEYMDVATAQRLFEEAHMRMMNAKARLEEYQKEEHKQLSVIGKEEMAFFKDVPRRLSEGKVLRNIWKLYCSEYNKEVSLTAFNTMVKKINKYNYLHEVKS